jgi:hypothetical protein
MSIKFINIIDTYMSDCQEDATKDLLANLQMYAAPTSKYVWSYVEPRHTLLTIGKTDIDLEINLKGDSFSLSCNKNVIISCDLEIIFGGRFTAPYNLYSVKQNMKNIKLGKDQPNFVYKYTEKEKDTVSGFWLSQYTVEMSNFCMISL